MYTHPAGQTGVIKLVILLFAVLSAQAQESAPGLPVVCYGPADTHPTHRPAPASLRMTAATARIDVTYQDVPPGAMAVFQRAADTWATLLNTPVPIHIQANWVALPAGVLASTKATTVYRGFAGAALPDSWYPVALAEKLVGHDLNGTGQADISITINQAGNWYAGLDGNTPANQLDLLSVILHEVAHGLGFTSAAAAKDSSGSLRDSGYLLVYDTLLQTGSGSRPATLPDPSPVLLSQLTSNDLYLNTLNALPGNPPVFPKVFAPAFFMAGGSISHLDEATYPPGDPNALMTPYFANGESVHVPGSMLLAVLANLGWTDSAAPTADLLIFPNPGAGMVTMQGPFASGPVTLQLSDLTGNVVRANGAVPTNGSMAELDVSGLAGGVYLLTVSTPARQWRRKLVLIR